MRLLPPFRRFRSRYSIAISILEGRMDQTRHRLGILQRWIGVAHRKSCVPFASYDILIHVFKNHRMVNEGYARVARARLPLNDLPPKMINLRGSCFPLTKNEPSNDGNRLPSKPLEASVSIFFRRNIRFYVFPEDIVEPGSKFLTARTFTRVGGMNSDAQVTSRLLVPYQISVMCSIWGACSLLHR